MNTTITRDIVLDLWPAYEGGEASQDTRTVVEAFLADDPQFAAIVRKVGGAIRSQAAQPSAIGEKRVVEATRRRLGRQRWMVAGAVLLTFVPLGFQISSTGRPVFLAETFPLILLGLPLALILWLSLWKTIRIR